MTTIFTQAFARLLLLPTFMVAIGVLFKGYVDVGDGFSAGVIAGLGVVIQYVAFGYREVEARMRLIRFAPSATFAGLIVVLLIAFVPTLLGDPIMTHYPGPGESVVHLGTIELITAVVFDVGVFLIVFGFVVTMVSMIGRVTERMDL